MTSLLRKLLLVFAYLAAGASLAAFLSGSTCIYTYGDCDDDDDDLYDDDDDYYCDDDDDDLVHNPSTELPPISLVDARDEVFRVLIARMSLSEEGQDRRVEVREGLSLFSFEGVDVVAEADVLVFARRILRVNAEVLGWNPLPRLISERVVTTAQRLVADFETRDGGRVLVELDLSGRLLALERRGPGPR